MSAATWPQPHEDMPGTDRDDWLLSLDLEAVPHREALIQLARHLHTATLVGSPAPVVARMSAWLRSPQPGDLAVAVEVLHGRPDPDGRLKGLGIFLGRRTEWATSDADWDAYRAAEPSAEQDGRPTEPGVFYLQYGPSAGDRCRWVNSAAIALPVAVGDFARDAAASRAGGRVVFTRASLTGGLADSGFRLRGQRGGPASRDGLLGRDAEVVARLRGLIRQDWEADDGYCADSRLVGAVHDMLWGGDGGG